MSILKKIILTLTKFIYHFFITNIYNILIIGISAALFNCSHMQNTFEITDPVSKYRYNRVTFLSLIQQIPTISSKHPAE
jgi:hypothetical protein